MATDKKFNELTEATSVAETDVLAISLTGAAGSRKVQKKTLLSEVYQTMSTGFKGTPPVLSINADPTKFDMTGGTIEHVDTSTVPPTITVATIAPVTAGTPSFLATETASFITIDSSGAVVQRNARSTPEQRRNEATVGLVSHVDNATLDDVVNTPQLNINAVSQVHDVIRSLGFRSTSGNQITGNADLTVQKSAGAGFALNENANVNPKAPHDFNMPALTPTASMFHILRDATATTTGFSDTIDPTVYDNAGVETTIPANNNATISYVYAFPNNSLVYLIGQEVFSTFADAKDAAGTESVDLPPDIASGGLLLARIILKKNATDLSDTNEAFILPNSAISSGGASLTALQQAYDISGEPEIETNSTNGAVSFKRGSAADTDTIVEVKNGADEIVFSVDGEGDVVAQGNSLLSSTSVGSSAITKTTEYVPLGSTAYDGTDDLYSSSDAALNLTANQTWACEFKRSDFNRGGLLGNHHAGGGAYTGMELFFNDINELRLYSGFTSNALGAVSNTPISDSDWHKVLITKSGNDITIYQDDVSVGSASYALTAAVEPFAIGSSIQSAYGEFAGDIRNVEIYSGAATNPTDWVAGNTGSLTGVTLVMQSRDGSGTDNEQGITFAATGDPVVTPYAPAAGNDTFSVDAGIDDDGSSYGAGSATEFDITDGATLIGNAGWASNGTNTLDNSNTTNDQFTTAGELEFDFGQVRNISSFKFTNFSNHSNRMIDTFEFLTSTDGVGWTTSQTIDNSIGAVYASATDNEEIDVPIAKMSSQYLKVIMTKRVGDSNPIINQIDILAAPVITITTQNTDSNITVALNSTKVYDENDTEIVLAGQANLAYTTNGGASYSDLIDLLAFQALGTVVSAGVFNYKIEPVAARVSKIDRVGPSVISNTTATGKTLEVDGEVVHAVDLDGNRDFKGSVTALTDGVNVAVDGKLGPVFSLTPTQNFTLDNPTDLRIGKEYTFIITQDGTGSRVATWDTAFKFAGGTAPVLSTAANAVDILACVSDGTNVYAILVADLK